jgi:hypothetical protein
MDGPKIEQAFERWTVGMEPGADGSTFQEVDAEYATGIGYVAVIAEKDVFTLHKSST